MTTPITTMFTALKFSPNYLSVSSTRPNGLRQTSALQQNQTQVSFSGGRQAQSLAYPANLSNQEREFLEALNRDNKACIRDFERMLYLSEGAGIGSYDAGSAAQLYPRLRSMDSVRKLQGLLIKHPDNVLLQRDFWNVANSYLTLQTAKARSQYEVATEQFKRKEISYEEQMQALERLLSQQTQLVRELGFNSLFDFYTGNPELNAENLASGIQYFLQQTDQLYQTAMLQLYNQRARAYFSSKVVDKFLKTKWTDLSGGKINSTLFYWSDKYEILGSVADKLSGKAALDLVYKTFDGLGLNLSGISQQVHFDTLAEYERFLRQPRGDKQIFIDQTKTGFAESAFSPVYPAENYLSLDGELNPYDSVGLHEAAHCLHHASMPANISYSHGRGSVNGVTEAYGILFDGLYKNRHWLSNPDMPGLSPEQSKIVAKHLTLKDLYILRLNGIILNFDRNLYHPANNASIADKAKAYQAESAQRLGISDWADDWSTYHHLEMYSQNHLAGFILQAQLEEYIRLHFGTLQNEGDDWYANPAAGEFLKSLFKEGNISPQELSTRLGYGDAMDTRPLLRQIERNLRA